MNEFIPVLKNKQFLKIWLSQLFSQITVNSMNYIVLVHIFEKTGSTIASSFIWIAYGIPALIFGPIAAAAVDIYDRRKVLLFSNIFQALVVLAYALLFQKYLFLSYGVVFAYSLLDQFYVPAETATLAYVNPKNQLPQANGLFFISQQGAALLGFGLAGLFIELLGFRVTIVVGSVLLTIAAISVSLLPRIKVDRTKTSNSVEEKLIKFYQTIYEGYRFIRYRKTILYPFLFMIWLQVSLAILVVNLPIIGTEILRTKPSLAGVLTVIPGGIGALLGTFLVSKLLSRKVRKIKIIETSLLITFIAFITVTIITPFLPFWLSRFILIASFFVVGVAYVCSLIPAMTYIQVKTPPKLMGRVFGNFWFIATVTQMIPVIFSATITEILGINFMLIILGTISGIMFVAAKVYVEKTFKNYRYEESSNE